MRIKSPKVVILCYIVYMFLCLSPFTHMFHPKTLKLYLQQEAKNTMLVSSHASFTLVFLYCIFFSAVALSLPVSDPELVVEEVHRYCDTIIHSSRIQCLYTFEMFRLKSVFKFFPCKGDYAILFLS